MRTIDVGVFKTRAEEKKYFVSDQFSQLVLKQIKTDIAAHASRIAHNVMVRHPSATVIELVSHILLNRRYRRGKLSDNNPDMIRQMVEKSVAKNKPVQLTISLFPCKIPNRLKTAGDLPDFAEVASLARLAEIGTAVSHVYPPGAQVIVLTDGRRFQDILNFDPQILKTYQKQLRAIVAELQIDDRVVLFDYLDFLRDHLPKIKIKQKQTEYERLYREYVELVGATLPVEGTVKYLAKLKHQSPSDVVNKIVDLYYSLLYSDYFADISQAQNPDSLTKEVFQDLFNYDHPDTLINQTRQQIVSSVWDATLKYVAEIASGRVVKPVEVVFPDSIRCDMHNIKERLTLYSVDRSTTLTPFHGTGFLNQELELNVRLRVSLQHEHFSPVYGKLLGVDYGDQPLFYYLTTAPAGATLPDSLAASIHLRK